MKVLVCNATDITGGASRAAHRIFKAIRDEHVHVKMLVMSKFSQDDNILVLSNYNQVQNSFIRFTNIVRKKTHSRIKSYKLSKYPDKDKKYIPDLRVSDLNNTLQKIDFDVLHLHWVINSFINFKDLSKVNEPIVWTLHDCLAFTGICHHFEKCENYKSICGKCPRLGSTNERDYSTEVFLQKQKRYSKLNLHFVCPSNWIAKKAQESTLIKNFPIHVIPNGIDTEIFFPINKEVARDSLNISKEQKVLLFVGDLHDTNKGFSYLHKSIVHLEKTYNFKNLELFNFGTSLKHQTVLNDIKIQYFDIIGNDKLLRLLYSAVDLLVLPSKNETLPNTIMESLACGTPVVAFEIGGNPDMIDHKQNGYLAQPKDYIDLADGIKWCLENINNEFLNINARKKILDNFTLERIGDQYLNLYKSLL